MNGLLKTAIRTPLRAMGYDIVRVRSRWKPTHKAPTLSDVEFPRVDVSAGNLIDAIMHHADFQKTVSYFTGREAASLLSSHSRALLYATIRNVRPNLVIEIGTFRAGTSEAICRALHANGFGILHTVD